MEGNKQKSYIFRFLRQARFRLSIAILIRVMMISFIIGFGIGIMVNIVALFIPIYNAFWISCICIGIVGVMGVLCAIFLFPNQKTTALEIDKRGLQERLTTFLELEEKQSSWSALQAEDTYEAIVHYNLKEHTKFLIQKQLIYCFIGVIVLFSVAAVLPSSNKELAIILHEQKEKAKEEIKKVEKAKEQLEELKELKELEQFSDADLKEIEKMQSMLEKAKEELREAKTKEELEKALERLETKTLQNISETRQKENQSEIANAKKKLEEFLKKMENQSKDTFSAEELKDVLDEETLQMLEETLRELLDELTEELEKMLEQLEASLSNGSFTKEQLKQLLEAMKNASPSNNMSSQFAEIIEGTLGISDLSNQDMKNQVGQTGVGNGNQGGTGNGTGSGNGFGTGNGTGQGGAGIGGGKNQGSKNGIEKENNRISKDEQVTISGRKLGDDENLTGQANIGESYQSSGGTGLTWSGEKVNYDEVVGEYTKEAYSRMENNEVPKGMEDVVKQYFEGINQ